MVHVQNTVTCIHHIHHGVVLSSSRAYSLSLNICVTILDIITNAGPRFSSFNGQGHFHFAFSLNLQICVCVFERMDGE